MTPTSRHSFWGRPQIARLLLPAQASARQKSEPRSPEDYLSAITPVARDLGGALGLAVNVMDAARLAVAAIGTLDRELAQLAPDVDPAEAARIEQRLAALGPEVRGDDELREVLSKHLALCRLFTVRHEELGQRRASLLDGLKALWRELDGIRGGPPPPDVAERLRTLCQELEPSAHERQLPTEDLPTLPR